MLDLRKLTCSKNTMQRLIGASPKSTMCSMHASSLWTTPASQRRLLRQREWSIFTITMIENGSILSLATTLPLVTQASTTFQASISVCIRLALPRLGRQCLFSALYSALFLIKFASKRSNILALRTKRQQSLRRWIDINRLSHSLSMVTLISI